MQQITRIGQRQGFTKIRVSDAMLEFEALMAHETRKQQGSGGKPKMSTILKNTKMSKTLETFADSMGVCAWGAIARETNTPIVEGVNIDWKTLFERVDARPEEMRVTCSCPHPECKVKDSILGMIPHLNDVHDQSFYDIGVFLEKYDL